MASEAARPCCHGERECTASQPNMPIPGPNGHCSSQLDSLHGASSAGLQLYSSRKSSAGSASYESRANAPFGPARCQRPASLGSSRGEGPGARPCPWWVRRAGGGLLYRISIRTQDFFTSIYMNRCQQPLSLCVSSAPSGPPADEGGSTSRAPCRSHRELEQGVLKAPRARAGPC